MFVRKKPNASGTISIQIVDKSLGRYRVVKTIGKSSSPEEVEKLMEEGRKWIKAYTGQVDMFAQLNKEAEQKQTIEYLISNIENILLNGSQLLLEKIYDSIGFSQIDDKELKQLVIARLSQPMSKSATVAYLKDYFNEDIHYQKIYRYMDKLGSTQQEEVQKISVEHTRKIMGGVIELIFYDVTTLYFETDKTDELRELGFSKDGKPSQPQIVLGLLVSCDGYPLSYSIFNGSQYEGHTMLPVVEDFIHRFKLKDFVIVADSGLMNRKNKELLEAAGYKYILGARIKNESKKIKDWIFSLPKRERAFYECYKGTDRLIVGYSDRRAKKDCYNRDKGVRRLQKAYRSGKITKENVNKRGYNKFIDIDKDVKVFINQKKIEEDERWDGLKGYLTNTDLSAEEIYRQYNSLWVIEKAFRVTKGTIELRPMFHFTPRRIEAHVCICFVAFKVYKELERILKEKKINLSVDKVISIAKTITTLKIKLPESGETLAKTMFLTEKQKSIEKLIIDPLF